MFRCRQIIYIFGCRFNKIRYTEWFDPLETILISNNIDVII